VMARGDGRAVHWRLQAMTPTPYGYVQVNAKMQAMGG
jgi:hypothetical protein